VSCVLLTGASGFVGRHLLPSLAAAGYAVRAAVRPSSQIEPTAGVEVVRVANFEDGVDWTPVLSGVSAVVHLAALAHTLEHENDQPYDVINRAATEALARAAANAGVAHFVFVSSIRAQCGPSAAHVLNEMDEPRPVDAYGRSKLAAEAAVAAAGIPCTIFRPVLVYGPQVGGNMERLVALAASRLPLPFGGLNNRRSLLAVDNLNAAIRFALAQPPAARDTYVVADPEPLSIADILTALRAAVGRRPGLWALPAPLVLGLCRIAGSGLWERLGSSLVVDPGKLMRAGWKPVIEARTALAAMMQAYTGTGAADAGLQRAPERPTPSLH
jgi:nucleoside-diphosphate-sugar epimerase